MYDTIYVLTLFDVNKSLQNTNMDSIFSALNSEQVAIHFFILSKFNCTKNHYFYLVNCEYE